MALLRRGAGGAMRLLSVGAGLAVAPAVFSAGLLAEPTRAAARLARGAAETGTRAVGTLVTGANPIPDGHVRSIGRAALGLFEPPEARRTRRVFADSGHVAVEAAAPGADDGPELRRALRRHLERLDGVQWATVNDV